MINIGDRVKFLSDTGVGIVKSINNGIASVDVDGFEIPVPVNEIVAAPIEEDQNARKIINPIEIKSTPKRQVQTKNVLGKISLDNDFEDEPIDVLALKRQFAATQKALVEDQKVEVKPQLPPFEENEYHVKLMLVPCDSSILPQDSDLDLYLVNDSTYNVAYSVGKIEKRGYVTVISNGQMEDDEKIKIATFKRLDMHNVINLNVSLMPFKDDNYTPRPACSTIVELHPLKFVHEKNYTQNDYFEQLAVSFSLADFEKE